MKRTMLAILAIAPVMMHAQVKSSAQPGSTPVLQSSNIQPAVFAAVNSSDRSATAATPVRVSTGVVPPQLVYTESINPNHILQGLSGQDRTVSVDMIVDENGKPTNLKVVKSADKYTDAGILAAVGQYRYKPATLNGIAVPMDVTLNVDIQ